MASERKTPNRGVSGNASLVSMTNIVFSNNQDLSEGGPVAFGPAINDKDKTFFYTLYKYFRCQIMRQKNTNMIVGYQTWDQLNFICTVNCYLAFILLFFMSCQNLSWNVSDHLNIQIIFPIFANICDNLIWKISNNKSQLNKVITDQLNLLMTDCKELLKLFLL